MSRAAHLVCSFAQFWFAKIEQRLPPDIVHGVPYCMDEYDRLFSSARIPLSGCDRWHERGDISKHIVILRGSHLYKVNVITLDGVICVDILEDILKRVILSSLSPAMTTNNLRLGDFTTAERDVWCHARSHLVQSSARTRSSLDDIDNAMFVLSLDLEPAFDDDDFVAVSLHGGHRSGTQEHRWYDKTNFIVDENGRASGNFEHSLYDGAAIRRLCDETWYMSNGIPTGREKWSYRWSSKTSREWFSTFSPLLFDPLNEKEKEILKKISNEHVQNQKNVHIVQGTFDDFGKDILKQEFSGASPDGILQILFKLTYAKVHGWNGKGNGGVYVYESCQTKRFLCGRTEVIRTATLASNQFVDYMMEHEMLNTSIDVNVARNLFRNAAEKHVEIAKLASNGQGVDRHLFSLFRLAGMEDGGGGGGKQLPSIFMDPAWSLSNTSVLSTSNLSSESFHGMGYGPVVQHGYGLAYGICRDALYFGISNFVTHEVEGVEGMGGEGGEGEREKQSGGFGGVLLESMNDISKVPTNAEIFKNELFQTLRQMRKIMSSAD